MDTRTGPPDEELVASLRAIGYADADAFHHANRYRRTFHTMQPHLPARCEAFLDIGCGRGGVAMHVAGHYEGKATAHILDGAEAAAKWVSYQEQGAAWADVNVALRLFGRHRPGMPVAAWTPATVRDVPACGLIYSNCSWGHHYAIETYLDLVAERLKPGGTLIVDLRLGEVGEHGFAALSRVARLAFVTNAWHGKKYTRTVWQAQ